MDNRIFLCIDLKSFYASVECIERGLDPMTTNLLVADASRTEKTICLAVSPSLKAYGISGRARLFEAVQQVKKANAERLKKAPGHKFTGTSSDAIELAAHPELELSYIIAVPRMAHYMAIAQEFIISTSSISLQRTSMFTPLTRCLLTLPTTYLLPV